MPPNFYTRAELKVFADAYFESNLAAAWLFLDGVRKMIRTVTLGEVTAALAALPAEQRTVEQAVSWIDAQKSQPASPKLPSAKPLIQWQTPPKPVRRENISKAIQWDNSSRGATDFNFLIGAEDAYEHTPFQPGERVAFCTVDKVAFHLSTWQFLLAQNRERCCICGKTGTIRIVQIPGAPLAPASIPAPLQPSRGLSSLDVIRLIDVPLYIGRAVVVEDFVHEVYRTNSTGSYFIRFEKREPRDPVFAGFKVCIRRTYVKEWDAAGLSPKMYEGQTIRVRGVIQEHPEWGIEILVNSPRVIEIVPPSQQE